MKILMVLTEVFPPDSRVNKEAISLSENGHEVHLVCYADGRNKKFEKTEQIKIHRLTASKFFKNKLSALALILPFFFLKWKRFIKKLHNKYDYDAIHIHDLPLSKVGYYFKKKHNCKLISDQHEFYSDWIKKTAHMNTFIGKMVLTFSNWEKYEKKYLELADLVITVAKPLEINYLKKYKIVNNSIVTIPNTPTKIIFNQQNVKNSIIEKYKNDFVIFYAGGIDILRGIDTAIIALKEIRKEIPNVILLLGGRVVKPYDPFETAALHGVRDNIQFVGWIDEEELPSYIVASNVCFFTPPANRDEINKTIATKIYQYAIMNRPIIVSDAKMMKDFVVKNNLGISIRAENSKEFANAVSKIYMNKTFSKETEIKNNWYWENTVDPLILAYQDLSNDAISNVGISKQ